MDGEGWMVKGGWRRVDGEGSKMEDGWWRWMDDEG